MSPTRRHERWRAKPPLNGLKVLSFNVNGLAAKAKFVLHTLPAWSHSDIIALQETRMSTTMKGVVGPANELPGWVHSFESSTPSTEDSHGGHNGVLICARKRPFLRIEPIPTPRFSPLTHRAAALHLKHTSTGASVLAVTAYVPTASAATGDTRVAFITSLTQWLKDTVRTLRVPGTPPPTVILAGDLNTIFLPEDSSNPSREPTPADVLDAWTTFGAELNVSDLWSRRERPMAFTWRAAHQDGISQSRLDMILAPPDLPAEVLVGSWSLAALAQGKSPAQRVYDHRPVFATFPTLWSAQPTPTPRGFPLPRVSPFWLSDATFMKEATTVIEDLLKEAPDPFLDPEQTEPNPAATVWLLDWSSPHCFPHRALTQLCALHKRLAKERQAHFAHLDTIPEVLERDPDDLSADEAASLEAAQSSIQLLLESSNPGHLSRILDREAVSTATTRSLAASMLPATHNPPDAFATATGTLVHSPRAKAECARGFYSRLEALRAASVDLSLQDPATAQLTPLDLPPELSNENSFSWMGRLPTLSDIESALRSIPANRAPGPDGLPMGVYRAGGPAMYSRLRAAYMNLAKDPSLTETLRFAEGVMILLPKGGDPTDVGNYRPITLLNSAYKILSKVLAMRLGPALANSLSPLQTGFLRGRDIGTNIRTVQAHDALALAHGRPLFAVFLDFAKAFDTVSRPLIWRSLAALGFPAGFIELVRSTLFHHTEARITVDGGISDRFLTLSGVRQGCCISPYLFVVAAEAMRQYLISHFQPGRDLGRGASLAPAGWSTPTACADWMVQYADDTAVLLNSSEALPDLVASLDSFASFSGLEINKSKTIVWAAGAQSPAHLELARAQTQTLGLVLVSSPAQPLKYLGIDPRAHTEVDARRVWAPLVAKVRDTIGRLTRLSADINTEISLLGRVRLVSTYALSKVLYHAEHMGMPTQSMIQIQRLIDAYVERGSINPQGSAGTFPFEKEFLYQPISEGGLGAPEVATRVAALHARSLGLLVSADTPWCRAMRAVLEHNRGTAAKFGGLHRLLLAKPNPLYHELPPQLHALIRSGRHLARRGLQLIPHYKEVLADDLTSLLSHPLDHFNPLCPVHRILPERIEPHTPSLYDGLVRHIAPHIHLERILKRTRNGKAGIKHLPGHNSAKSLPISSPIPGAWLLWVDHKAWGIPTPITIDSAIKTLRNKGFFQIALRPDYDRVVETLPESWIAAIRAAGAKRIIPNRALQDPPLPHKDPTLLLGELLGWLPRDNPTEEAAGEFRLLTEASVAEVYQRHLPVIECSRIQDFLDSLTYPPEATGERVSKQEYLEVLQRLAKRPHIPYTFDAVWRLCWRALPSDRRSQPTHEVHRICPFCRPAETPQSTIHAYWLCPHLAPVRQALSRWAGLPEGRELFTSELFGFRRPPNWPSQLAWDLVASTFVRVHRRLYYTRTQCVLHDYPQVTTNTLLDTLGRNLTCALQTAVNCLPAKRTRILYQGSNPGFDTDPRTHKPRARPLPPFLRDKTTPRRQVTQPGPDPAPPNPEEGRPPPEQPTQGWSVASGLHRRHLPHVLTTACMWRDDLYNGLPLRTASVNAVVLARRTRKRLVH